MKSNGTESTQYKARVDLAKRGIVLNQQICQLLGLDAYRFPLNQYCIYSGPDFKLGSSLVAQMSSSRTMEPLEGDYAKYLQLHRAQLSFSQLAVIFNSVPTRLRLLEPISHFTIAIPLHGNHSWNMAGKSIVARPTQGLLVKSGEMPDIVRSENSIVLVATLTNENYQQLFGYSAEMLTNAKEGKLPVLLDLLDAKYRLFLSILGTLCKCLDEERNAHIRQDIVIGCLEKALWNQFDDIVPQFETESPIDQDYTLLPKHLRKTVDYIHANADTDLNMTILETLSGVSSRSLQAGFKEWLGIRPMYYVKKVRLAKVRSDLLIADPSTTAICDIAAHWGFFHMSNFSKDFRNEFGELPSDTLYRSAAEFEQH